MRIRREPQNHCLNLRISHFCKQRTRRWNWGKIHCNKVACQRRGHTAFHSLDLIGRGSVFDDNKNDGTMTYIVLTSIGHSTFSCAAWNLEAMPPGRKHQNSPQKMCECSHTQIDVWHSSASLWTKIVPHSIVFLHLCFRCAQKIPFVNRPKTTSKMM